MANKNTIGLLKYSKDKKEEMQQRLEASMQKLLFQLPYNQITISRLCADANVSRMAYYAHFTNKDQILQRLVLKMNKQLIETVGSPFDIIPDLQWYKNLFTYLNEKKDFIKHLFEAGFHEKYLDILNNNILNRDNLTPADKMKRLVWSGGIINLVKNWANAPAISIDLVATSCYRCLEQVFKAEVE